MQDNMQSDSLYINVKRKLIFVQAATWKRLLAFILDYLILNAFILFPFNKLVAKLYPADSFNEMWSIFMSNSANLMPMILISVIMSVIALLYFVAFEAILGQTLGKMSLRLFIVSSNPASRNAIKERASIFRIILRNLTVLSIFVMPVIYLGDCAYAYFNKDGQRYCEYLSKTKTVEIAVI